MHAGPSRLDASFACLRTARLDDVFQQEGLGEVIALRIPDARGGEQIRKLFEAFDALGDDRHTHCLAYRFDRPQNALAARPLVDIGDERAIDLDLVGGNVRKHESDE
jgi:hypothetical protein